MRTAVAIAILVLGAGCAHTDRFALVDRDTQQEIGPFSFRDGATVDLGARIYTLKKLESRDQVLSDKLRAEIIAEVEFRDADVRDVVQFFRRCRRQPTVDEDWADPSQEIILVPPPGKADAIPKVTLIARQVSMYNLLKMVADITGLEFVIADGNVWLKYRK